VKLTKKQKDFCEYYLQTGNAAEAARKAGYSAKTARVIGPENLSKPDVLEYIESRRAEMDKCLIADTDEVLKFYSSVMRGEVKDQFGLEASLSDRLKAGDSLMKRFAAAGYKQASERTEDPLTKSLIEEAQRLEGEDNAD
jgi:phage terminase small subunit